MVKKLLPIFLLLLAPSLLIADGASASSLSIAKTKDRANDVEISALRASLQAKLIELHKAASFPAATLGFVLPDGRSGSVSVGLADVEKKIPLKPADRMLAGSIGKTYVSAVMLQAVQKARSTSTQTSSAGLEATRGFRVCQTRRTSRFTIPSDRRVLPAVINGYSMPNSPFGFEGRVILDGKFIINPQMEWTGGGFASTAEDLARWAKLLYEGKVLKKETLDQMLNGVDAKEGRGSGAGNRYGLAVQIRPSEWGVSYGHGGWFPGYRSEMEYFPQQKIAIAVQFNTDDGRTLKKGLRAYIADAMRIIVGEIEKKNAA